MRSRRATQSFTFTPSGKNGETEFSTEFIQGPFNDTMSDEEAHRLLSSGRTRSLPSIQRVIDRKEKQIAKKKATGKSKILVQNGQFSMPGASRVTVRDDYTPTVRSGSVLPRKFNMGYNLWRFRCS